MQKKQCAVSKVAKSSRTEPVKATVVCFLFSFFNLSNGSVYEATEPAVKASEAAHEATELVAKASEAAHAQHKDHVFIIRFTMIALGLSTMEASKTWTNSGNLRMPGCSSM